MAHNHVTGSELYDEVLEVLFTRREDDKRVRIESLLHLEHFGHKFSEELLDDMVKANLIRKVGAEIELTPTGLERATRVSRCHRLAERLLVDVLRVEDEYVEPSACRFEHILSEEIADSICTLLGHPRTCPHGRVIPPGECCRLAERQVLPILRRLSELSPGDEGDIAYISSRFHERLTRLASLGISPGQRVTIRQVKPAFIISFGETELALERQVASEIFLRIPVNHARRDIP